MLSCGKAFQPLRPAVRGRGTTRTSVPRSGILAQTEFISAEHLKSVRAPKMAPSILGVTQKQLDELHIALVKPQE